MSYQLSLLDKSPIPPGATAEAALRHTTRMALRAEELGYRRFWLAEHHASPLLAGAAPEILVAHLLARTTHIRIGSGGVMLQHYSPYKVAEQFRVLAALAPGRVDLGVGKAPGGLPLSTRALQARLSDAARAAPFEELLADLDRFLGTGPDAQGPEAGHALHGAVATPQPATLPQRVLLGGSVDSALLAARRGWAFCFAGHFNGDFSVIDQSFAAYRAAGGTQALLALYAFAAEQGDEARQRVGALRIVRLTLPHRETGDWLTGPSVNLPNEAAALEFARQAGASDWRIEERRPHVLAGSADELRTQLDELAQRWQLDEFVIDTPVPEFAPRLRSIELLARAHALPRGESAGADAHPTALQESVL